DPEILSQESMKTLLQIEGVHDILPVGSHGIAYEARMMAESAGLQADLTENKVLNTRKSAGPSTCVLLACTRQAHLSLQEHIWTPVYRLGIFKD
ncbi:MAG: selenophosphate synthase, partial [Candidatus Marinimicrobia bacterium]|nr:selenophosphate synthase [Candidatus Neomarinimicrobiota bacterium]